MDIKHKDIKWDYFLIDIGAPLFVSAFLLQIGQRCSIVRSNMLYNFMHSKSTIENILKHESVIIHQVMRQFNRSTETKL